jgi:hypothetical protein
MTELRRSEFGNLPTGHYEASSRDEAKSLVWFDNEHAAAVTARW